MKPAWQRAGRGQYALYRDRTKLGYVESDDSKWVAVVFGALVNATEHKTRREAKAWVEARVTAAPATV